MCYRLVCALFVSCFMHSFYASSVVFGLPGSLNSLCIYSLSSSLPVTQLIVSIYCYNEPTYQRALRLLTLYLLLRLSISISFSTLPNLFKALRCYEWSPPCHRLFTINSREDEITADGRQQPYFHNRPVISGADVK